MRCDTCKQESALVMRVVIAKGYDRSLARPIFNCPSCFEHKEQTKFAQGSRLEAGGKISSNPLEPRASSLEPPQEQRPL